MHICEVTYSLQLHINDKRLVHGRVKKMYLSLLQYQRKIFLAKRQRVMHRKKRNLIIVFSLE